MFLDYLFAPHSFSCPVMGAFAHNAGSPRFCEGRGPERGPQEAMKAPGKLSAPESLLGDVPDLDVYTAINLAMNRVEWKANRPSKRR